MDMDRDEKNQASALSVEKKSKLPAEQRNKKRGRLSTLIRERAEKKKALSTVMSAEEDKSSQIPNSVVASSASKNLLPLSTNDTRFNFSRLILDALNTGDIDVFEETLRRLCSPEVISTHLYTGSLEHSPLGPNSRVIIGYDAIMSVWRDWFKIAPDSVFLLQNPSAFVDKKTNNVTSSIHYTSLFTRVLEGKPKVDQESVEKMENFKNNLFNAPVNSATGIATTIIPRVKPVSTGPVNRGNSFKFVNTALQQQQQTMTANTPAPGQMMYNNNADINNDHNTHSNTHSSSILKTLSNDGSAEENEDIDTLIDSLLEYDSNVIGVSASEQQDAYNILQYQQFQGHHQQQQQQQQQSQQQYMYDHQLLVQQQYELQVQQLQQQQQQQQFHYDNTINNSYGTGGVNGYFEQPTMPVVSFAAVTAATAAVAAGSASVVSPARDAQQVNPVPLMTKSQAIVKDESFFSQSILHGTKNSGGGSSNSSNSNSNSNITSSHSNSVSSIHNSSSSNDVVNNNSNATSDNATAGQTTKKSGTAQPVVTIVPPKRDLPGAVVKEIIRYTYDGVFSVNVNPQKIITKMNFSFSINVEESSVSSGGSAK